MRTTRETGQDLVQQQARHLPGRPSGRGGLVRTEDWGRAAGLTGPGPGGPMLQGLSCTTASIPLRVRFCTAQVRNRGSETKGLP